MENLLEKLNAQIKFIKKYKLETDGLLSITTYRHSGQFTLYIGEGNSNKIMSKLIEEGYEFEKSKFEESGWLEYRIDFNVDGLQIDFIKKRINS
jgi:hypothetical protein